MITNLYVLFAAIGKAGLMTGLWPGMLFVYVAEKLVRDRRVPAHHRPVSWSRVFKYKFRAGQLALVEIKKARVRERCPARKEARVA